MKFQVEFRFCKATGNFVTLLKTYPAKKKHVQSQQQKHQENMSIDCKNNIKNTRTTSPDLLLFAGVNCPEVCSGQFFLEHIPICIQKSAFSFDAYNDFSACTTFQNIPSVFRLTQFLCFQNFQELVVRLFVCGYPLYASFIPNSRIETFSLADFST